MKTKDLIIEVALIILNERGEVAVNSVDFANEMNISPGNLYYHFKGKKEIVEELYARFHVEFTAILSDFERQDEPTPKVIMAYLCLISEVFTKYSFISQDTVNLYARYPAVKTQFSKQLNRLHQLLICHAKRLPPGRTLDHYPNSPQIIADNILNTLLNIKTCNQLIHPSEISQAMGQSEIEEHLYLQILPYL